LNYQIRCINKVGYIITNITYVLCRETDLASYLLGFFFLA